MLPRVADLARATAPAPRVSGASDACASGRVIAPADARYAGGLVPGSKTMEIFADIETELALAEGGDEGLCAAYHGVEYLAPLRAGDFVDAVGREAGLDQEVAGLVAADLFVLVAAAGAVGVVGGGPGGEEVLGAGDAAEAPVQADHAVGDGGLEVGAGAEVVEEGSAEEAE